MDYLSARIISERGQEVLVDALAIRAVDERDEESRRRLFDSSTEFFSLVKGDGEVVAMSMCACPQPGGKVLAGPRLSARRTIDDPQVLALLVSSLAAGWHVAIYVDGMLAAAAIDGQAIKLVPSVDGEEWVDGLVKRPAPVAEEVQ